MAAIQYTYNRFEFDRDPLEAIPEAEYAAIREDFDRFVNGLIDDARQQFRKLRNPHSFNWKIFLVLIALGLALLGTDRILKNLGYYDAGELCAMISFVPFFAVAVQPIQWLLTFSKSSSFESFEEEARTYFLFHQSKIEKSTDYNNYRVLIARTELKEYTTFYWSHSGTQEQKEEEVLEEMVE